MKIARYIPGFVDDDDFEDYLTEVSSMKELLAIEWVHKWSQMPEFVEWVINRNSLFAMMSGQFQLKGGNHPYFVAYAYFTDDRPYFIEEPGYSLPDLNDLPKE